MCLYVYHFVHVYIIYYAWIVVMLVNDRVLRLSHLVNRCTQTRYLFICCIMFKRIYLPFMEHRPNILLIIVAILTVHFWT